jgi:glycosyltransferase involved in cell wall biosynthesis
MLAGTAPSRDRTRLERARVHLKLTAMTDTGPAVSILISAHNSERFIEQTLQSILAQTFTDFECVVVNDGSTDRTAQIVARYTSDPRVILLDLPKVGLCAALNRGLELTRAPLIARMDSDDVMFPQRLSRQVAFLNEHPELGGCASFYYLIDEHGNRIGDGTSPLTSLDGIERHLANGGHLIYPNPTAMLRRSVIVGLGAYRHEYFPCEDVDLFVRMLEAGRPVLVMPEFLLNFRIHGASVSANNAERQFHTNRLIFRNYHARKHGKPVLAIEDYLAGMQTAVGVRRLARLARVKSFILHRRAARAKTDHQKLRGNALMLLAMALDPIDAYWKVVRRTRAKLNTATPT